MIARTVEGNVVDRNRPRQAVRWEVRDEDGDDLLHRLTAWKKTWKSGGVVVRR